MQIAIVLYPGLTALDAVGPYEILRLLPDAEVRFGAAAGAALVITPDLGAYLVAAGLLGHAAWDAYHHRTNRVVVRSLAEFCLALDIALAVAIVTVTVLQ
jgi:hypothetical protein